MSYRWCPFRGFGFQPAIAPTGFWLNASKLKSTTFAKALSGSLSTDLSGELVSTWISGGAIVDVFGFEVRDILDDGDCVVHCDARSKLMRTKRTPKRALRDGMDAH